MNDISYFEWLMSLVGIDPRTQARDLMIANELYHLVYRWHLALDENRALAGINLRKEFAEQYVAGDDIPEGPCNCFEMLVALARRMSENSGVKVEDCYHEMIKNMKLYSSSLNGVDRTMNDWMDGHFGYDGSGSPFPLHKYHGDCRNLDIWSQMTIYINENYPLDQNWLK